MESDFDDDDKKTSPNMADITKLLASLSQQISNQSNFIQDQLLKQQSIIDHQADNDLKLQSVLQDNESFKRDVKLELESLRSILVKPEISVPTSSPPSTTTSAVVQSQSSGVTSNSSPHVPLNNTTVNMIPQASGSQDSTNQVMLMLADSFSKLSTMMGQEKSNDMKYEWPKFAGDSKNFKAWYLAIIAQLSLPQWQDLYDISRKDVVKNTSNGTLNSKLYAKLITCLEGSALQSIVARTHLHSDGISVLHDLYQTHRPLQIPEIIAAKTVQFWGSTKRFQNETVDAYYNRFKELYDEIQDAEGNIPVKNAIRHFIFTLGSEFESIQNNYRIDNLPSKWNTEDWPTILILCRNYYNSIRPQGISDSNPRNNFVQHNVDRMNHQKKVKEWFLHPAKYCKEIAAEQKRYPNKCIYHLSDTHGTNDCHVKKACEKQQNSDHHSTVSSSTKSSTGQLRHLTEDIFVDAESDAIPVDCDTSGNDTNEESLLYFTRVSNHYLRLVKNHSSVVQEQRHPMSFPVIADSGANYHMFKEKNYFESLSLASGSVLLGDGKTTLSIKGIGTVVCKIEGYELRIPNVRYIPDLGESIYSLFVHIQTPGHGLESSFDKGLFIKFPEFSTQAIIGRDDIYLDMQPILPVTNVIEESEPNLETTFCRKLSTLQNELNIETKQLDNILRDLRQYYNTIKTKRQLGLEVPAGFRRDSTHKMQFQLSTPPRKSSKLCSVLQGDSSTDQISPNIMDTNNTFPDNTNNKDLEAMIDDPPTHIDQSLLSSHTPIIRSVDKVSSSLPQSIMMTEDYLRACVGFRRVDTILRHFDSLYLNSVRLDNSTPDAVLDPGYYASLRKKNRNTTPVPRTIHFADVFHIDIVFGPEISVGNIHYGLLCVDRCTRMTYIYPLQNLSSDIPKQLQLFFSHLGIIPKRIISDFDLKLIGGKAREFLNNMLVHVNAAPSYRQDKNGLAERHWQTIISMARNWLASAELPPSFWFYAVRRAAEVCNYFPFQLENGLYSTPFEMAYSVKPDLRLLFKPFSLAAVRRERVGDETLSKFSSQSIPMITLGRCPHSDGLQFFNPENGTIVSSIDYTIQPNITSGARFGYKYHAGTFIYRLDESTTMFSPKFALDSTVLVHTHSPPHIATIIGTPSYVKPDIYTVKFQDNSIAEYSISENLLEATSSPSPKKDHILPDWIQGGATATLFLSTMSKPRHGRLYFDDTGQWIFCAGKSADLSKGIVFSDLPATCENLLATGQLFRGHTKFQRVYQARAQVQLRDCVLRHVSAHGLTSLMSPSSLKQHANMLPSDKQIWDDAYDDEYDGLSEIPTWEVISEAQFKLLSKGAKPLPSMAISTIKYDAFNKPKRAKYRIVVLGNLDYHQWSKESVAAPVMSQLELRLLTSLAVYHKRILKNCDVKQAFVQSSLPPNEEYFVKPPIGCPRSPPGTYWRLIRSLYGLRRAPKLWFEKLSSHLTSMGLRSSSNSPCLFVGSIIDGEPPIYIGIYVDDIIYFSPSDTVERKFEEQLSTLGSIDFMGQVTHFLGIEFTWHHHQDGNISVNLTQQSFVEMLLESLDCNATTTSSFTTPYRTGLSIDSIPPVTLPSAHQDKLRLQYQSLVGSLNWLAHTTRPDLSTVVSLLAQHQSQPSPGHLDAALYVATYLSHTKTLGIYFSSAKRHHMETFLHFPLEPTLLSMADANWGPQDATTTKYNFELPLFASRSMSAFYVDLLGPLHWMSKRQSVTAGSSAEAEIYATNECVKFLLELVQIMDFLGFKDIFMPATNVIYNDNNACINWSRRCTTKGLRHIQMKENHVRENVERKFVSIEHIGGKQNLADLFTKEMKDTVHFVELRDIMMRPRNAL